MKTNQDYKNAALAALKGRWAPAVVCAIVYVLALSLSSIFTALSDVENQQLSVILIVSGCSIAASIFLFNPLTVGFYNTMKEVYVRGEEKMTASMFRIGFGNVIRNSFGMLLMQIFIFLWCLLLLIPGIIKSFSYALTPYILADSPELTPNQAINLSSKMMKGHRFDLFWLMLSFIGWMFLGVLTLGIGYFWLMPYMYVSIGAFYEDVKKEYTETLNL